MAVKKEGAKKSTKSGTKKPAAKTGRPRKAIDEAQFKKLCGLFCTLEEIAGFFECSEDTIERWTKRTFGDTFAEVYKIYSAPGKISLRRYQFLLAEKSAGMAIFLGKNYLGQKDVLETSSSQDGMLAQLIDGLKEPEKEGDNHADTVKE